MAGHYPYCPGPGDEATWGPIISPMDPRWDGTDDLDEGTDDEGTDDLDEDTDDEPETPLKDYGATGTPASLLGVIIAQILDPKGTAHRPIPPAPFKDPFASPRKQRNRRKDQKTVEEWRKIVASVVAERPGVSVGELRETIGIRGESWNRVRTNMMDVMFFIDEGPKRRLFMGVKPETRLEQKKLLAAVRECDQA